MENERIPNSTKHQMVGMAIFFDSLQALFGLLHFIPAVGNAFAFVMGYALSILALLTFFVWFSVRGVSFLRGKKMARRALLLALEYIPLLNSLPIPGWTFYTLYTIKMVQSEDKHKRDRNKKEGGGKSNLRLVKGDSDATSGGYKKAA